VEPISLPSGEGIGGQFVAPIVTMFAALAHADRLRLVVALGDDELSVNHLADIVDLTPDDVRRHLEALEFAGVVAVTHHCELSFYRLTDQHIRQLVVAHLEDADRRTQSEKRGEREAS